MAICSRCKGHTDTTVSTFGYCDDCEEELEKLDMAKPQPEVPHPDDWPEGTPYATKAAYTDDLYREMRGEAPRRDW